MVNVRPWPGRSLRAEPSSSQLRMSRLWRETRRGQHGPSLGSALAGVSVSLPCPCSVASGSLTLLSTCCEPCTDQTAMLRALHPLCQASRWAGGGSALFLLPFSRGRKNLLEGMHLPKVTPAGSEPTNLVIPGGIQSGASTHPSGFAEPSPPRTHSGGRTGELGSGRAGGSLKKRHKKDWEKQTRQFLLWGCHWGKEGHVPLHLPGT